MRCGIAQSVARVGNTSPDHCRHSIGYQLARSVLYEALAVLAGTYPSDVILVNHILSIQWCAVRARRRVLPIRRSVRTVRWSTPPDVGRAVMCVARKGFGQSYVINTILSLPTEVRVLVVPPPVYLHSLTEASVGGMLAVGRIVGVTASEGCYAKV